MICVPLVSLLNMHFTRIRLGGLLLMVVDKGVLGGNYSTSKILTGEYSLLPSNYIATK